MDRQLRMHKLNRQVIIDPQISTPLQPHNTLNPITINQSSMVCIIENMRPIVPIILPI